MLWRLNPVEAASEITTTFFRPYKNKFRSCKKKPIIILQFLKKNIIEARKTVTEVVCWFRPLTSANHFKTAVYPTNLTIFSPCELMSIKIIGLNYFFLCLLKKKSHLSNRIEASKSLNNGVQSIGGQQNFQFSQMSFELAAIFRVIIKKIFQNSTKSEKNRLEPLICFQLTQN